MARVELAEQACMNYTCVVSNLPARSPLGAVLPRRYFIPPLMCFLRSCRLFRRAFLGAQRELKLICITVRATA